MGVGGKAERKKTEKGERKDGFMSENQLNKLQEDTHTNTHT